MATALIRRVKDQSFFSSQSTVALVVGTASSNVALVNISDYFQALITNVGANVVYIAIGTDSTVAAAIPAAGTPALGIPVLPNSTIVLSIGNATYIAAIAAATGNDLYITVGSGTL